MEHRFRDIGEDKLTEKGYLETHGLRKATETQRPQVIAVTRYSSSSK